MEISVRGKVKRKEEAVIIRHVGVAGVRGGGKVKGEHKRIESAFTSVCGVCRQATGLDERRKRAVMNWKG